MYVTDIVSEGAQREDARASTQTFGSQARTFDSPRQALAPKIFVLVRVVIHWRAPLCSLRLDVPSGFVVILKVGEW